jgi:hypothetical protein
VLKEELRRSHNHVHNVSNDGISNSNDSSALSQVSINESNSNSDGLDVITRDVTSGARFVGDSSGLFFGNIVQAVLLQANYKGQQGPSDSSLRLRVGGRKLSVPSSAPKPSAQTIFPDPETAHKLQNALFTHRWPALPFIHKPTFFQAHYSLAMSLKEDAPDVSLFLTFMVFALGAIDLRRQDPNFGDKHVEYFSIATQKYLFGLLKEDSIETVQGLLLVAQFSVNEHQSANAWLVAGQAVRTAIDLGLHRDSSPIFHPENSMLTIEMRKRVFWSAYALDRNISIALGRPCAVRDSEIDVPLPQNLTDDQLEGEYIQFDPSSLSSPNPLDMSTFVHIIKLRQLQSRIQELFYSADTSQVLLQGADHHRSIIRTQLDEWVSQAPRYVRPTVVTFQSTEWFQIAHSHALLLLYRPSPANPVIDVDALQICADSAISLISAYSSLYAKNKITYTWIALHSLFMASITMLYTIWVSPEIRGSTTKAVVKSNVLSCLALFDVMGDVWPLASRCYDIIDRLGILSITLFESSTDSNNSDIEQLSAPAVNQHFGQIDAEFVEWFGTRESHLQSSFTAMENPADQMPGLLNGMNQETSNLQLPFTNTTQLSPDTLDFYLQHDFDTSIPMMMTAFGEIQH